MILQNQHRNENRIKVLNAVHILSQAQRSQVKPFYNNRYRLPTFHLPLYIALKMFTQINILLSALLTAVIHT